MNGHGLSETGEHESEAHDGKSKTALAQSHGCAQGAKPKTPSGKNKIKTRLTRLASLEMTHYPKLERLSSGAALLASFFSVPPDLRSDEPVEASGIKCSQDEGRDPCPEGQMWATRYREKQGKKKKRGTNERESGYVPVFRLAATEAIQGKAQKAQIEIERADQGAKGGQKPIETGEQDLLPSGVRDHSRRSLCQKRKVRRTNLNLSHCKKAPADG